MNAEVIELEEARVIRFDVTDTAIAKLKVELTGLTEYKAVTNGIAVVRDLRVSVEATRKQAEALQAERDSLKAERDANAKADLERQAKLNAEADAKWLEALRPDIEKVRAFGVSIEQIKYPGLNSKEGESLIMAIDEHMGAIVKLCKEFQS